MAKINIPLGADKATQMAIQKLSAQLFNPLSNDRIVYYTDGQFTSINDLTQWITGTTNRITVANDGDGTVTLNLPQDIHTGASPTFVTVDLTGITDGNLPYMTTGGFANSSFITNGTGAFSIGTHDFGAFPGKLTIHGTDDVYLILRFDSIYNRQISMFEAYRHETAGSYNCDWYMFVPASSKDLSIQSDALTYTTTTVFQHDTGKFLNYYGMEVGKLNTTLGTLKFYGNTSGNVTLQPNAIAGSDIVLTLPVLTGTLVVTGSSPSLAGLDLTNITDNNIPYMSASGFADSVLTNNSGIGIGEVAPVTVLEITNASPYLTLHCSTNSDAQGARESRFIARGQQSGGEETILGYIAFAHDGAADDEKGSMWVRINDGNDGVSPSLTPLMILSNGRVGISTVAPDWPFQVTGTSYLNGDVIIDGAIYSETGSKDLNFGRYGYSDIKVLGTNGFVGIGGITTPISLLEVQGGLTTVGAILTLGTQETTVEANDVLGRINFYAPLEASGTDAVAVGASIVALAEATFTSSVNKTSMLFQLGSSEVATTKMTLLSTGKLGLGISPTYDLDIYSVGIGCVVNIRDNNNGAAAGSGLRFGNDAGADRARVYFGSTGYAYGGGAESLEFMLDPTAPIIFGTKGTERMRLTANGGMMLTEIAADDTDIAGKGQLWVKNDTPNILKYTDDAGTAFSVAMLNGISGSFTTVDLKTVTVVNGLITAIV